MNNHIRLPYTMTHCQLVRELISLAYDTGYYSGKREDFEPHHLKAIKVRESLRAEVLRRLRSLDDGRYQ